jgi:hypothetical protein
MYGTESISLGHDGGAGIGTERSGLAFVRHFTSGLIMQPCPGLICE